MRKEGKSKRLFNVGSLFARAGKDLAVWVDGAGKALGEPVEGDVG